MEYQNSDLSGTLNKLEEAVSEHIGCSSAMQSGEVCLWSTSQTRWPVQH